MAERRHGPMHHAEISHLGHAAKLLWRDLPHRREHRHHRVIDPDIDAAARARDRVGGLEYGIGVGGDTNALPPSFSTSCLTSSSAAASRAIKPRVAPERAKHSATARPTPAEAPVMTTVRLRKSGVVRFMLLIEWVGSTHHSFNGWISARFRVRACRARRRDFSYCRTCDADSA